MKPFRIALLTFLTSLLFLSNASAQSAVYQVDESLTLGSEFSREFYNNDTYENLPDNLRRNALAVASFGLGSAFYVGSKNGKQYMMTAAHTAVSSFAGVESVEEKVRLFDDPESACLVYPDNTAAGKREFHLGLLDVYYECEKLVYINFKFDIAIFEASANGARVPNPIKISFEESKFIAGSELTVMSYSSYNNRGTDGVFDLAVSQDSDCVAFESWSNKNDFSDINLITDEVVNLSTIPVGCDIVPGDSGGPVFNRETGGLIGLVSAGLPSSLRSIYNHTNLYRQYVVLPSAFQETINDNFLNQVVIVQPLLDELSELGLVVQ